MTTERLFVALGALLALLGVAFGAFGAHALREKVAADLLATFETGARYQMYHAIGLLATGLLAGRFTSVFFSWTGWLFLAGTVVFSGSLYLLTLTGARWWGAITPIGGACFLAGWACLFVGVVTGK
jgi:uncharacterized membrane protein YgdD (TMEM256/DUF423 family)